MGQLKHPPAALLPALLVALALHALPSGHVRAEPPGGEGTETAAVAAAFEESDPEYERLVSASELSGSVTEKELVATLKKRSAAVSELVADYQQLVTESDDFEVQSEAMYRIGNLYRTTGLLIRSATPPERLTPEQAEVYADGVDQFARQFDEKGNQFFETLIAKAEESGKSTAAVERARAALAE